MKKILLLIFVISVYQVQAQSIHYFKVQMGPKLEKYSVQGNSQVQALRHIDVGAGFTVGKRFSKNTYAEISLFKNDYTSKFEVTTQSTSGEELKSFKNVLYPTFTSVQLGVVGGYRQPLSEYWEVYAQGGLQFLLNKKLSREGSELHIERAVNEDTGYEETIELYTFSNGLGGSNFLLRADLGMYRNLTDLWALDFGVATRYSNVQLNEYEIEYVSASYPAKRRAKLSNTGTSIAFHFGLKYRINAL